MSTEIETQTRSFFKRLKEKFDVLALKYKILIIFAALLLGFFALGLIIDNARYYYNSFVYKQDTKVLKEDIKQLDGEVQERVEAAANTNRQSEEVLRQLPSKEASLKDLKTERKRLDEQENTLKTTKNRNLNVNSDVSRPVFSAGELEELLRREEQD